MTVLNEQYGYFDAGLGSATHCVYFLDCLSSLGSQWPLKNAEL